MKTVRAKFTCVNKEPASEGSNITLEAVTGGSEENDSFFQYTPSGQIQIGIVNEETAGQFEVGQDYYVDFTQVQRKSED